jgi:hypothetical protein
MSLSQIVPHHESDEVVRQDFQEHGQRTPVETTKSVHLDNAVKRFPVVFQATQLLVKAKTEPFKILNKIEDRILRKT